MRSVHLLMQILDKTCQGRCVETPLTVLLCAQGRAECCPRLAAGGDRHPGPPRHPCGVICGLRPGRALHLRARLCQRQARAGKQLGPGCSSALVATTASWMWPIVGLSPRATSLILSKTALEDCFPAITRVALHQGHFMKHSSLRQVLHQWTVSIKTGICELKVHMSRLTFCLGVRVQLSDVSRPESLVDLKSSSAVVQRIYKSKNFSSGQACSLLGTRRFRLSAHLTPTDRSDMRCRQTWAPRITR